MNLEVLLKSFNSSDEGEEGDTDKQQEDDGSLSFVTGYFYGTCFYLFSHFLFF